MNDDTATSCDFEVSRRKITEYRCRERTPVQAEEGDICLRMDRFALTANNITYASFGDAMHYWDFFSIDSNWGRVPVWGFADVITSRHPEFAAGERIYGFFPMSSDFVLRPGKVSKTGFVDISPHRSALPAAYNHYIRSSNDPRHQVDLEIAEMVFRPLFLTSYLIDDFLRADDYFQADQVVLSSASSKTSLGLAFALRQQAARPITITGLTSAANVAFVEALALYDKVIAYPALSELDPTVASVYVDMAGSAPLRHDLHSHFRDALKYSCAVGASHWDAAGVKNETPLPGPKAQLFFAPGQYQRRAGEIGTAALMRNFSAAWAAFIEVSASWLTPRYFSGLPEIAEAYAQTVAGSASPDKAYILSF